MTVALDKKRLKIARSLDLLYGSHEPPKNPERPEACLLELEAWVFGEVWGASPSCVSPVLWRFGQRLNDRWNDEDRQLLKRFLGRMGGTAGDGQDDARVALAASWAINTGIPDWLELAGLTARASELRSLAVSEWSQDLRDLLVGVREEIYASRPYTEFRNRFRRAFEEKLRLKLGEEAGVAEVAEVAEVAGVAEVAEVAVAAEVAEVAGVAVAAGSLSFAARQEIRWATRKAVEKAIDTGAVREAAMQKVRPLAETHRDAALDLFEQMLDPSATR